MDQLRSNGESATVPYEITVAYVLALLGESKTASIHAVGLDGYAANDPRQQEMVEIFNLYYAHEDSVEVVSLTPTTYSIGKGSIYAPSV